MVNEARGGIAILVDSLAIGESCVEFRVDISDLDDRAYLDALWRARESLSWCGALKLRPVGPTHRQKQPKI